MPCNFCNDTGWVLKNTYAGDIQDFDAEAETVVEEIVDGIRILTLSSKQSKCHACQEDGGPGSAERILENPPEYVYPETPQIAASVLTNEVEAGSSVIVTVEITGYCSELKINNVSVNPEQAEHEVGPFDSAGPAYINCEAINAGGSSCVTIELTVVQ